MDEKITLVFSDGTRWEWNTGSLGDARKAIAMQKRLGDPVEIIGDGKMAKLLREKYAKYNAAKKVNEEYRGDLFKTASEISGNSVSSVKAGFERAVDKMPSFIKKKIKGGNKS